MDKTNCMICKKELYYSGLPKHIFSSQHSQNIIDAILKRKQYYEDWLKKYEQSPSSAKHPSIAFTTNVNDGFYFCHLCKFLRPVKSGHLPKCSHLKETVEFIKHALTQTPSSDTIPETPSISSTELESMKKKIQTLEKHLKQAREIQSDMDDTCDAYFSMIQNLHESYHSSFETVSEIMKQDTPKVYAKILKDLGYNL